VSGTRTCIRLALVGLLSATCPLAAQAQPQRPAPTAVQTDNQYQPIVRDETAPEVQPDEDGRFPVDVRAAFGRGIWFGDTSDFFALQLRVRAQLAAYVTAPPDGDTGASAEVRRLRLVLGGHVLRRLMTYYIQLGYSSGDLDDFDQVPLRDAFATFHFHPTFNLRVGQMKVPFDRQRVGSSSTLQFVDRAQMIRNLNLDRDIGIQLYGTDVLGLGGMVSYQVGVFAGEGRNQLSTDPGLLYMGRVQVGSPGFLEDFVEGDLSRGPARFALAASVGFNHRAQRELSTFGEFYQEGYTSFLHLTTDIVFKAHGYSLFLAGMARDARESTIGDDPAGAWGLIAQNGYLLPFADIELVARVVYQRPLPPSSMVEYTEIGGGVNWYILGHDLKLQVDYRALVFAETGTAHEGRAQLQLYF